LSIFINHFGEREMISRVRNMQLSFNRGDKRVRVIGEYVLAGMLLLCVLWLTTIQDFKSDRSLFSGGTNAYLDPVYGPPDSTLVSAISVNDFSPVWLSYPYDIFNARSFAQHSFPDWNPYNGAGAPILAQGQSNPFNPLKLIYYLTGDSRGYDLFLLSRLFVAGLATFAFARLIGLGFSSALAAALIFTYSGTSLGQFPYSDTHVNVLLPLLLLGFELLARNPRIPEALLCGLSAALIVLSGHPEPALLCLVAGCIYYAVRVCQLRRTFDWRRATWAVPLALVAFLGIVAMPILSFKELITESSGYSQARPVGTVWANHFLNAGWPFIAHLMFPTSRPMTRFNPGVGAFAFGLALIGLIARGARRFPAIVALLVFSFALLFLLPDGGVYILIPVNVYAFWSCVDSVDTR